MNNSSDEDLSSEKSGHAGVTVTSCLPGSVSVSTLGNRGTEILIENHLKVTIEEENNESELEEDLSDKLETSKSEGSGDRDSAYSSVPIEDEEGSLTSQIEQPSLSDQDNTDWYDYSMR